ncbi:MAG: hypothetical protein FJ333_05405 [Sphingomonadales bacterium]|nr:hypothetical protein [Sphingomonadales bacterium]
MTLNDILLLPGLLIELAKNNSELREQHDEIQAIYQDCCDGWLNYDDALALSMNDIDIKCEEDSVENRFACLNVDYTLQRCIAYINCGNQRQEAGDLRDTFTLWRLAFHQCKIVGEATLSPADCTLFQPAEYHLFRAILSLKYLMNRHHRQELSKFKPLERAEEREIILPAMPDSIESMEDEATSAALQCKIVRPTVRIECVIGQKKAIKEIQRSLITPTQQPEAGVTEVTEKERYSQNFLR